MAVTFGGYATGTSGRQFRIGYEFVVIAETGDSVTVELRTFLHVLYGVSDSANSHVVSGNWSRSGNCSAVCTYNNTVQLWSQQQTFAKGYWTPQNATFASSLGGLEVFGTGTTATVGGTYVIAARTPTAPATPAAPSISSIGQNSCTVNMSLPSNNGATITSTIYNIYTAPTGGTLVATITSGAAATSQVFSALNVLTTYYAAVKAVNSAGTSGESARTAFTTLAATSPDAPAMPTVSTTTQTDATLNWVAPSANGGTITGYNLQVSLLSTFGTTVYDISTPNLTKFVEGLTGYTNYYARVRANSHVGYSDWSPTCWFITSATVPSAPGVPVQTQKLHDGGIFSFAPATAMGSAITGYLFQVANNPSFTSPLSAVTSMALARTIAGLPDDTLHYARVQAQSALGAGAWSPTLAFYTRTGLWRRSAAGTPRVAELWYNDAGTWKMIEINYRDVSAWKVVA